MKLVRNLVLWFIRSLQFIYNAHAVINYESVIFMRVNFSIC